MTFVKFQVPRWVKVSYLAVVILALAWVIFDSRASFRELNANWSKSSGTYVFLLAWVSMAFTLGGLWALLLRWRFGVRLSLAEWIALQSMAWAARYLPGKVGVFSGRLTVAETTRLGIAQLGWTVLFEQAAFAASGACVALLLVSSPEAVLGGMWPPPLTSYWPCMQYLLAVLVVGAFIILFRVVPVKDGGSLPLGRHLILFGLYLIPHMIVGSAFYLVVREHVQSSAGHVDIFYSIGLLALANVAGMLAIFSPAGFGVREMVIAAGLIGFMPFGQGLALAAAIRLMTLVADVIFCGVVGLQILIRRMYH